MHSYSSSNACDEGLNYDAENWTLCRVRVECVVVVILNIG